MFDVVVLVGDQVLGKIAVALSQVPAAYKPAARVVGAIPFGINVPDRDKRRPIAFWKKLVGFPAYWTSNFKCDRHWIMHCRYPRPSLDRLNSNSGSLSSAWSISKSIKELLDERGTNHANWQQSEDIIADARMPHIPAVVCSFAFSSFYRSVHSLAEFPVSISLE